MGGDELVETVGDCQQARKAPFLKGRREGKGSSKRSCTLEAQPWGQLSLFLIGVLLGFGSYNIEAASVGLLSLMNPHDPLFFEVSQP